MKKLKCRIDEYLGSGWKTVFHDESLAIKKALLQIRGINLFYRTVAIIDKDGFIVTKDPEVALSLNDLDRFKEIAGVRLV